MHAQCPVCGEVYEKETGFFWAAMYFSFAINVALFVTTFLFLHNFFHELDISSKIAIVLIPLIATSTLNFRYSRVICLYLLSRIKLDPRYLQK